MLLIIGSIGLAPVISFAQNIGSACGDQWNILPKCGLGLECVWENSALRAVDWPGVCAAKEKPKELPTWFGTEDRVAVNRKTNWFNTLISSWVKKPITEPEKRVQICKKDLSGRCIDRDDTYAVQMVTRGSVYTAPQAPKLMPCITEKEPIDNKKGLECLSPQKETWKEDANGYKYTVCEEEKSGGNKPKKTGGNICLIEECAKKFPSLSGSEYGKCNEDYLKNNPDFAKRC